MLEHLRFVNIFNDGRNFEQEKVYHMNSIWVFDSKIFSYLPNLEELNLVHLNMQGYISEDFVNNCKNLKYLNLAHNNLTGTLPDIEAWSEMKNLSFI